MFTDFCFLALPNTSIDTSAEESTDYTQNTTAYESALEESQNDQDQDDDRMLSDDYYQQHQQGQFDQEDNSSQQYNQDESSYQQDDNSMSQQYQEDQNQDDQLNDESYYNNDGGQNENSEQGGYDSKEQVKEKYGYEMDVENIKQEESDVKQEQVDDKVRDFLLFFFCLHVVTVELNFDSLAYLKDYLSCFFLRLNNIIFRFVEFTFCLFIIF